MRGLRTSPGREFWRVALPDGRYVGNVYRDGTWHEEGVALDDPNEHEILEFTRGESADQCRDRHPSSRVVHVTVTRRRISKGGADALG